MLRCLRTLRVNQGCLRLQRRLATTVSARILGLNTIQRSRLRQSNENQLRTLSGTPVRLSAADNAAQQTVIDVKPAVSANPTWVDRYVPPNLQPYLNVIRLDRP